ncbi:MAG: AMP-dependent synthetase and ligase [Candidatus Angelobacter sp.]|jgi:long-chain acyl-CoA synthetase|nr:AMP-dependent synthetase and ligase [Candidatus Angelobacter sp.]
MARRSLVEHLEYFYTHARDVAYVQRRGYRREAWTYRRALETACQFARELDTRGICKGDHVVLWGDNCAEWVVAFLGCMMRGVIVVPMDRAGSPDFALRVAQQVNAKLLVASRELLKHAAELPTIELESLPTAVADRERLPLSAQLDRSDTLQIIFTSGTTAEPRGVVISHGNVLANLEPFETEIKKYLKYERIFRFFNRGRGIGFLNLLPLSHVFGEFLGIFIPPLIGGTVVFQEGLNPAEVIATIRRETVSVLVAVPRMLDSLKTKIERDFESAGKSAWFREHLRLAAREHFVKRWWRFRKIHNQFGWKFWAFVSGGATLDAATEEFWRLLGLVVIQGYGLTETTSLISVNHPFHRGRGSIGKVLPGRDMRLGEGGEILIRGDNVATGYWQAGAMTPVAGDGNEWFHTGDLGEMDAEGFLHFKGRKKDVIVTAEGMNIYPEDLESALKQQPEVRDAVVFGLARNGNAEPCAVVIASDDTENAVRHANERLAPYQQIRHWYQWPESDFPRTATQKPKTAVIAKTVQEQLRSTNISAAGSGSLAEIVERVSARRLQGENLDLSSIERVDLLCALEERYQVDLDESELAEAKTLSDLQRIISHTGFPATSNPTPAATTAISATEQEVDPVALASASQRARANQYQYPRWAQHWPVTWIRNIVYYLLTLPATHLLASPRVIGREKLRDVRGPVLAISNHVTYVDVGFVLAALPPRLRSKLAVAMEGERLWAMRYPPTGTHLFRRIIHPLAYFLVIALFNVFPLPKLSGFRESFAYAGESVGRGYSVLVFPEGLRTRTGGISRFQSGIGMLTAGLNIPIVPMRIDGLFELKQKGKRFAQPGTVTVNIGEPLPIDPKKSAEEITAELEQRVRQL